MSGDRRNLSKKKQIGISVVIVGVYAVMRWMAKKHKEPAEIDSGNMYIRRNHGFGKRCPEPSTVYERSIKPALDRILSFTVLLVLLPLFAVVSLAIYIDDPGPVLFTQKRVGKGKKFFTLHKFRSMKMSTPHDVPTHRLENPEQYITKVGRVLRKTSLDELPQIWDIFRGKMSTIGPRPALWNQEDLVAEREKYGANDVMPGLTGWAQINGRDELEITEKARLDGEYTKKLKQGGIKALFFDLKCFFSTIKSVLESDGVVEGGTGKLHREAGKKKREHRKSEQSRTVKWEQIRIADEKEAGFEDYGYRKSFHIDYSVQRRILIIGAGSYIGEAFEAYAKKYYGSNFLIDTADTLDGSWRETDFGSYDVVFHVAGIAHADVGNVDEATKKKYYAVNTDLAIEAAGLAKAAGVGQFILMSSMIIYGASISFGKQEPIDEYTLPFPANFYGDSKWQADKGVRNLADMDFHVAVLRPPMIYGPGSKGNYPALAKLAKRLPVFPAVENKRSMLYIDNLCEFLCLLMLSGEGGVYFPQNGKYTNTCHMVQDIADTAWHPIRVTRLLNPAVIVASYIPGKIGGMVQKAFGNSIYDQKMSVYEGLNYQIKDLKASVAETEKYSRKAEACNDSVV